MIRITFEAKNREDLIETIRDYLGSEGYSRDIVIVPPVQIPKPEEDAAPEPAPAPKTPEPTSTITKEDVRQAMLAVRNKLGAPVLRGLLQSYKSNNIDELQASDYNDIVLDAKDMLKEAKDAAD